MLRLSHLRSTLTRQWQRASSSNRTTGYAALPVNADDLSVMVFGAGTDVGKTSVIAGLSSASMKAGRKVCYLKPVQTGDLDEFFIQFYTNPRGINDIFVRTLHHWKAKAAPQFAAKLDRVVASETITDQELLSSIQREIKAFSESAALDDISPGTPQKKPFIVVETSGGALSPGPSGNLQADLYRSLRMPIVLVADGRLGGISTTLTAYESLRIRGYTVHALVMIAQDERDSLGNAEAITRHFDSCYRTLPGDNVAPDHPAWSMQRSPRLFSLSPMPKDRNALLHSWFQQNDAVFLELFRHLESSIYEEWHSYEVLQEQGVDKVWWPLTNHATLRPTDVGFVESAHGDHYRLFTHQKLRKEAAPVNGGQVPAQLDATISSTGSSSPSAPSSSASANLLAAQANPPAHGRPVFISSFDGSGSWWTQAVGHGHSTVALAMAEAAGRYGHVLFPRNLHAPVVQLSRYLVDRGPGYGWASRVFYSDNGSSAMEIAFKMANRLRDVRFQKSSSDLAQSDHGDKRKTADEDGIYVISQSGGHHGDTLAMLNAIEKQSHQHPWRQCRALSLSLPLVAYHQGHLRLDFSALRRDTPHDEVVHYQETVEMLAAAAVSLHSTGDLLDVATRSHSPLATFYRQHIQRVLTRLVPEPRLVAALLMEPVLLGAGGMRFVDPLFQKILVQECRLVQIPIVFDEVAVGMYRLGPVSASDILEETPDIACYGKMLTGGYAPLAVTLTTDEVFRCFNYTNNDNNNNNSSGRVHQPLLHGHSSSASPVACAAALEVIRLLETSSALQTYRASTASSNNDEADMRLSSQVVATHDIALDDDDELLDGDMSSFLPVEQLAGSVGLGDETASPEKPKKVKAWKKRNWMKPAFLDEDIRGISKLPGVKSAMSLGGVLSIQLAMPTVILQHPHAVAAAAAAAAAGSVAGSDDRGDPLLAAAAASATVLASPATNVVRLMRRERVFARPLGPDTVYLIVTPLTSDYDKQRLLRVLRRTLTKAFYTRSGNGDEDGSGSSDNAGGSANKVGEPRGVGNVGER